MIASHINRRDDARHLQFHARLRTRPFLVIARVEA